MTDKTEVNKRQLTVGEGEVVIVAVVLAVVDVLVAVVRLCDTMYVCVYEHMYITSDVPANRSTPSVRPRAINLQRHSHRFFDGELLVPTTLPLSP